MRIKSALLCAVLVLGGLSQVPATADTLVAQCTLEDFTITGRGWTWRAHIGPAHCARAYQFRMEFKLIKASGFWSNWTDYRVVKEPDGGGWGSTTWDPDLGVHVIEGWTPALTVMEEGVFKARISFDVRGDAPGPLMTETVPRDCEDRVLDETDGCWPSIDDIQP